MSGGTQPPVERLTLFDLDNTLLGGDSDYGWAQFLIEQGAVDAEDYERRNAEFFADYKAGRLDIHAFLEFQLRPLADNDPATLFAWRERFVAEKILPMLLPAGRKLVDERLAAGDLVAVVTATNSFITRPDGGLRRAPSGRHRARDHRRPLYRAADRRALLPGGQARMPGGLAHRLESEAFGFRRILVLQRFA